jgi:hypothetical protein
MRLLYFFEPNLFWGSGLLKVQQTIKATALSDACDLDLAVSVPLARNMNFVTGQGAPEVDRIRAAALVNLEGAINSAIVNSQIQLCPKQVSALLVVLNIRVDTMLTGLSFRSSECRQRADQQECTQT